DPYTRGHSEGVAEYSVIIAKELGFSKEKQEVVRLAGLLHDIGKIGIDEKTLLKPTSLTEEEYLKIKGHPGLGVKIIAPIKKLEEVISGVRNHHERFDGCGYPDGLRGKDIDILARIVALADTFDAMTSDRAYRKAYPLDEALKEIESCANTQFDPEVVAAFFRAYKKGLIKKVY
ncbi:TPA: hypothetical protein DCX15_00805, partial [bacterium]|nr:hypothetical protein [bacterium]